MKFLMPVLALFVFATTGCERSPTLAKVGGKPIKESDLAVLAEVNPRLQSRLVTPEGKRRVLENYVEQNLLYQEAMRRGLHRADKTRTKIDLYKRVIIAQAVLDDELDKKVQEYYDGHKDEFERVKFSHILVRTVEEVKDPKKPAKVKRDEASAKKLIDQVRERLGKGEDFAKVAESASEDERTKKIGGDLGVMTLRDKRLERSGWLTLSEQAFAMKTGEVSEPIKTKDGFHLIKVTEEKTLQPIAEASTGVRFRIQSDVRKQLLDGLQSKYKVEYVAEKKEAQPQEVAPEPSAPATLPEAQGSAAEAPKP